MAAIAPLLENRDGTIRLEAARLLASVNPDAAKRVLNEAATDPNPAVRAEAARILEETTESVPGIADLSLARRMLRDRDAMVRLRGAGVLLAAARAGV
jgi:HEAT repeat protein